MTTRQRTPSVDPGRFAFDALVGTAVGAPLPIVAHPTGDPRGSGRQRLRLAAEVLEQSGNPEVARVGAGLRCFIQTNGDLYALLDLRTGRGRPGAHIERDAAIRRLAATIPGDKRTRVRHLERLLRSDVPEPLRQFAHDLPKSRQQLARILG